mgnify:CR=1 FL=1
MQLFKEITNDVEGVRYCKEKLEGFLADDAAASLEMIITSVESAKEADFLHENLIRHWFGECLTIQGRSLRFLWTSSAVR